jgi:hypothetical protein
MIKVPSCRIQAITHRVWLTATWFLPTAPLVTPLSVTARLSIQGWQDRLALMVYRRFLDGRGLCGGSRLGAVERLSEGGVNLIEPHSSVPSAMAAYLGLALPRWPNNATRASGEVVINIRVG